MKRLIFVTGRPGIGKTSVLLRAVDTLREMGHTVGGMISRESREGGVRVGFEIVDVYTRERGWLAHVNQPVGPRVGKYRVNISDLNAIGASSILNAVAETEIVVVDEIGPMELFSRAFKEAVFQSVISNKPMMGIIHYRARDPLIAAIITRKDSEIFEVTCENRENLHNTLINRIVQYLQRLS